MTKDDILSYLNTKVKKPSSTDPTHKWKAHITAFRWCFLLSLDGNTILTSPILEKDHFTLYEGNRETSKIRKISIQAKWSMEFRRAWSFSKTRNI